MTSNFGGLLVVALAAAPLAAIPLALAPTHEEARISAINQRLASVATVVFVARLNGTYEGSKRP